MSFNSLVFLIFFLIVYILYVLLRRNLKIQNSLLLIASYVFYGSWDWRFLSLLAFVTLLNFIAAKVIHRFQQQKARRQIFVVAVSINFFVLGIFKYLNFFGDSFSQLMQSAGIETHYVTLHIILPVGISFYIFQAVGYLVDVYRRQMQPSSSLLEFALYVSFFPQLVAGPIERAKNLLPQLSSPRRITTDQVNLGIYLILWGFFKKVVIADNLAQIADPVFGNYLFYQGADIVIGVLAFTLQIYCDFSGYSDVARGLAKLLGIELMVNFRLPYFAVNPRDFWQRWHISLSTWLRDYLYIPMGGNREGTLITSRNLGATMLLCGLWHGAGWNFILWGAYHWIVLSVYHLAGRAISKEYRQTAMRVFFCILLMLCINFVGWIIFRSTSVEQIIYMLGHIGPTWSPESALFVKRFLFFSAPLTILELWQYFGGNLAAPIGQNVFIRSLVYGMLLSGIITYGVRAPVEFIYFQF